MAIGNILVNVRANISDYEAKMNKVAKVTQMSTSEATYALQRTGGTIAAVGSAIAGATTVAIGGATAMAAQYEQEFTNVRKVLEGSEADFDNLSKAIRNMSKEIPMSRSEIAGLAEVAGRLGVPIDEIEKFTRVTADLGVTTNMSAADAAEAFARFANVMDMPLSKVDRLGSTVVDLGNNFATSEREIVNMGQRMSGVARTIGFTEAETMALAAAISSTGIRAEAGGSAFTRVSNIINKAVGEGKEDLDGFAKVAGMSSKEFADAWKKSPAEALLAFTTGLGELSDEGKNTAMILDDLGIKGVYNHDLMNRLAGSSDNVAKALRIGNKAWEENTALQDEANQRYGTFISKLTILWNRISDVILIIGNELMAVFSDMIDILDPVMAVVENLAQKFEDSSDSFKRFVAIALLLTPVVGAMMAFAGVTLIVIGRLIEAARVAQVFFTNMKIGGTLIRGLVTTFTPLISTIGLVIVAIVAIGAALVVAYNKFEWFREVVDEVWGIIKENIMIAVGAIKDFVVEMASYITEFWNENGEQILEATKVVWGFIQGIFEKVMPVIVGIIKIAWIVIEEIIIAVWDNIKGVIQGATDIILGIIKVFSSLFTGDWTGLWEGVKQLLSGAIKFIWNLMQLMFWGRLIKGLASFAAGFRSMFSAMWEAIKGLFTRSVNAVKNVFSTGFNFIKNFATTSMGGIRNIISTVWSAIKRVFSTMLNLIKGVVDTMFGKFTSSIRNKMGDAVTAVSKALSKMWNKAKEFPKKFLQVGKDLIQGLIDGILNMGAAAIDAITGVVDGVIGKAKSLLKIKSPSRVFRAIGAFTGEGMAEGIVKSVRAVNKASEKMTEAAIPNVKDEYEVRIAYSSPRGYKNNLSSAVRGTVDVRNKEETLVEEIRDLKNAVTNMKVVMDEREVGTIVEPVVTENQDRKNNRDNRFRR